MAPQEPHARASVRPTVTRDLAGGATAGVLATLAMSTLMLGAQRLGLLGEQPPRKISNAVLDAVAPGADEPTRQLGTTVVHLGIGALAGAAHQLGRRAAGRPEPAVPLGAAVGGGFWALNYWVLAPATGLMPPPDRDRGDRPVVMLVAHVVWGAVSALLGDRLAGVRRGAARSRRSNVPSGLDLSLTRPYRSASPPIPVRVV